LVSLTNLVSAGVRRTGAVIGVGISVPGGSAINKQAGETESLAGVWIRIQFVNRIAGIREWRFPDIRVIIPCSIQPPNSVVGLLT